MGCRPSKQATSKVRAIEHKDDPSCLCSPRKIRKNQKCSSASNYSRATSGGSARGSKAHILSSSHKARSSRSADVDFPAFSTTTAVYRTSASRTSKITLRLSCDGSTLQIEQCDYDLEKVRGQIDSKPRPWNSAPNLTKLRESKSRLFRDSYFPIKHSISGWSPCTTSAASSSKGGLVRVPVQINSPDESLSSTGNISGHLSSGTPHNGNTSYRDTGNTNHALFESTFCAKTFGRSALSKSQTSNQFSSGDERRPLLLDILRESHKKANIQGNVNKAASPVSVETVSRDEILTRSSLDNMIDQLESSLAVAHFGTQSSRPNCGRSSLLDISHAVPCDHLSNKMASLWHPQNCTCQLYTSDQSADVQQIPVNVITSCITCQGQAVVGVEHNRNYYPLVPSPDRNYYPLVPSPDVFYFSNPTQVTRSSDTPLSIDSIDNMCPSTASPCVGNNSHQALKMVELENTSMKGSCGHTLSDTVWTRLESLDNTNRLEHADDGISTDSDVSQHFAISIDPESVLSLDKQNCPVLNNNSSFMSSSVDRSSVSLYTPECGDSCLSGQGYVFHLEESHTGVGLGNLTKWERIINSHNCHLCGSNDMKENIQAGSWIDKSYLTQNKDSVTRRQGILPVKSIRTDSPLGAEPLLLDAHNSCPNTCQSHTDVIDSSWNGAGGRRRGGSKSLQEIPVKDNHIILLKNKQHWYKRLVSKDRNLDRNVPHQIALDLLPMTDQTTAYGQEMHEKIRHAHSRSDGDTVGHISRDIVQMCAADCSKCVIEWTETSGKRGSESTILHSNSNISQPMYFPGGFNEKTGVSQQIDGIEWGVEQTLDLTPNNDTKPTFSDSNAEESGEDKSKVRDLNVFDKHELDRSGDDAGYLVGLLFPDRNNPVSSHASRIYFDLEFSDGADFSFSSTSDSSDKEVSPTGYSLLDELFRFQNNQTGQPGIDSEHERIYLEPSQINNIGVDMSCQVGETCLVGFLEQAQENDVMSLAGSGHLLAKEVNSIKRTSNIIHGNAQVNKGDNEQKNKADIITLGCDNLARNSAAIRSRRGNDVGIQDDTLVEICGGQPHTLLGDSITGINPFSSLHTPSDDPEGTHTNSWVLSDASQVQAKQQLQLDSHSGQILIERLTSGLWHTCKNSSRRQSGQIIDPQDRSRSNVEILACPVNPHHYVIGGLEKTLETPKSGQYLNNATAIDRPKSREDTISCTAENRLEHEAETDSTRSQPQGHFCDLTTRKGPQAADETLHCILADDSQISLNTKGQTELMDYKRTHEFHRSKLSISEPISNTCAAEEASARTISNGDFLRHQCSTFPDECENKSQITDTVLSRIPTSVFCKKTKQMLSAVVEQTEQMMVTHDDDASLQFCQKQHVSETSSQDLTCASNLTSHEALWNSYSSENSNTSETAASSACKETKNFQSLKNTLTPPEQTLRNNGALEGRSSLVAMTHSPLLKNSKEAIHRTCSTLTSEQNSWSMKRSKLSHLSTNSSLPHDFTKTTGARCLTVLEPLVSLDNIDKKLVQESSQDESRLLPRNNVLSLVRYFEKVPYSRRGTKQ